MQKWEETADISKISVSRWYTQSCPYAVALKFQQVVMEELLKCAGDVVQMSTVTVSVNGNKQY